MNWETEQAINMIGGNFEHKEYILWTMVGEDIINACKGQPEKAKTKIAEELAEHTLENVPVTKEFYATILGGALSQVNWDEVAGVLIDTVENL